MRTFKNITFGCRVNQYESQSFREALITSGWSETQTDADADVFVLNSCTVTASADRECVSTVRSLHRKNPDAKIVVTGCFVQKDADRLKDLPGVRLLVGTGQKHRVAEFIQEMEQEAWTLEQRIELDMDTVYAPLHISAFQNRSKAFVKVQDGCDRVCAFCKIPYVRGRSRSRELDAIVQEIDRLVINGFQEVVLTGVAIGLWGQDLEKGQTLADLVEAVDQRPGKFRIRLSSLDPRDVDDRFIEALRRSQKVCHHLHLSLQSGSDGVLERMNRGHTAAWYFDRVSRIRSFWTDFGLTTDWIVGFPGETDQEFRESMAFCERLQCAKIHVFPYSKREKTPAYYYKEELNGKVIKERAKQLRDLASETANTYMESLSGSTQDVLIEELRDIDGQSFWQGYTPQFVKVLIPGEAPLKVGEMASILLEAPRGECMFGNFFTCVP